MATQLTPESPVAVKRRKYNRLMSEAETAFENAVKAAHAEFEKIAAPDLARFEKAIAPHEADFDKATSAAVDARDDKIAQATAQHANAHAEASKAAGFTS